jgi:hypothetical protein
MPDPLSPIQRTVMATEEEVVAELERLAAVKRRRAYQDR